MIRTALVVAISDVCKGCQRSEKSQGTFLKCQGESGNLIFGQENSRFLLEVRLKSSNFTISLAYTSFHFDFCCECDVTFYPKKNIF